MAQHNRNLNLVRTRPPRFSQLEIMGFCILGLQVVQMMIFCYMSMKGH